LTIDWWTFGLQTVNVLILIWLLARFFWRPVAAMISERRQQIQSLLDQAHADRDASAQALAEAKKHSASFADEREKILAQARQDAAEARRALLEQAEAEAVSLREGAKAALAQQLAETEQIWRAQASKLAVTIAGKLAGRLEGQTVTEAFLRWLRDKIGELPADVRQMMGAAATVEIVSAMALDAGQQARITAMIGRALGATPAVAFRTDPELIAGLELHTPHFVLTNSWRADLAKILAELSDDERH